MNLTYKQLLIITEIPWDWVINKKTTPGKVVFYCWKYECFYGAACGWERSSCL
jgi:hypothetical protein